MSYLIAAAVTLFAVIGAPAVLFLCFGSLFPDFDWPDDEQPVD